MADLGFDILTKSTSPIEIRRIFQQILTKTLRELGSMAKQNSDAVSITGGTMSGVPLDLDDLFTDEMDTFKVLKPDGAGSVAWGTADGGAGVDRVVEDGETRTIADTFCLTVIEYIDADGTGEWAIEGDAVIDIYDIVRTADVGDERVCLDGEVFRIKNNSSLVVAGFIHAVGTGEWKLEGNACIVILT